MTSQNAAPTTDPAMDAMQEQFATEEASQQILLNPKAKDAGASVNHAAGLQGRLVPTGYAEELRKGNKSRAALEQFNARPSAVTMYAWNGVPSEVPIAYGPGGTNPSISRYLRKRHCNTCGNNGFITNFCAAPGCGSADVIQLFYQSLDLVPTRTPFYGEVPCLCSQFGEMTGECPRDGRVQEGTPTGFLTPQQMLMHASSKHRREFSVWQTVRSQSGVAPATPAPTLDDLRADLKAELLAELKAELEPKAPLYVKPEDKAKE